MTLFVPFPKLARLSRGCVITEKLDGTNAAVVITEVNDGDCGYYRVEAQSRTRMITPGKTTDNYGFAAWVKENEDDLKKLGPGHHYGEWYGQGIQRNYGLTEKRFALFNPERWPEARVRPACVSLVPVLWDGEFCTDAIETVMESLHTEGSVAVPGFKNPEGIVVYHSAARCSFKKTFDDQHKEAA
jgi:hypothetical protein